MSYGTALLNELKLLIMYFIGNAEYQLRYFRTAYIIVRVIPAVIKMLLEFRAPNLFDVACRT